MGFLSQSESRFLCFMWPVVVPTQKQTTPKESHLCVPNFTKKNNFCAFHPDTTGLFTTPCVILHCVLMTRLGLLFHAWGCISVRSGAVTVRFGLMVRGVISCYALDDHCVCGAEGSELILPMLWRDTSVFFWHHLLRSLKVWLQVTSDGDSGDPDSIGVTSLHVFLLVVQSFNKTSSPSLDWSARS